MDHKDYKAHTERQAAADRLEEIKDEIKNLITEALHLMKPDERIHDRARAYWYAHIVMALDKDHMYLGGSMVTMQDTIDEIREDEDGPDHSEDSVDAEPPVLS